MATIKPRVLPWAKLLRPFGVFVYTLSRLIVSKNYSAPSGLVKIVRSIQGAALLATYYAPLGLKSAGRPDKFRRWTD